MKRIGLVALAGVLLLSWLAPPAAAQQSPKRGGTLTVAISKDLKLMNPLVETSSTEARIRHLIYESLLGVDLKGKIQPNLAESWRVSPDGKMYTFTMRRGVRFHNGQEVTAEDAKFAIDYTLDPKNGAYGYAELSLVERAEAPDRYTLRIYMKKPSPPFLASLTDIGSFSVIPKGSLKEGIGQVTRFPPGTGPFKFVEWQPRQRIVFERNDGYWGDKAYLDRVVLRLVSEATMRLTALQAGDVDIIERTPYEWVKEIVEGKIKGIGYAKAPYAGARNLEFNVADPPFNDKKLRLAVAHAIDRKEILQAAYFGLADTTDQRFPQGHVWNFEGMPVPTYDVNKARQLLKESSYKGQAIYLNGNLGEVAEIEGAVIQAQLKKIGIKVELKIMERAAALDARRKGEYAFKLAGGSYYLDPSLAYQDYVCEPNLRKRIRNEAGYCNREFDALILRADTEVDPEKRRALFRELVTRLAEDVPIFPIGFTPRFFGFRDHVKGFSTNASGDFQVWGGGLSHAWVDK